MGLVQNQTIMKRSNVVNFFVLSLMIVNTYQTEGLAAILNRVRNNSIWGKGRRASKSRCAKSCLPVQVRMAKQASTEHSSLFIANVPSQKDLFFDPDAYRQEMTDLVYQRSMQRLCNARA